MAAITHQGTRQIVTPAALRAVLREHGERCYCAPESDIEWDAGDCPEHQPRGAESSQEAGTAVYAD